MRDWKSIGGAAVRVGNDEDGFPYIIQFCKDYKSIFGTQEMNIGCSSCLNAYFNKLTKYQEKMANPKITKSKAILLKKYEGIQLHFGSPVHVTNATMTEEQAIYLLEKHPHGAKLFDVLPKLPKKEVVKKEAKKMPTVKPKKTAKRVTKKKDEDLF